MRQGIFMKVESSNIRRCIFLNDQKTDKILKNEMLIIKLKTLK